MRPIHRKCKSITAKYAAIIVANLRTTRLRTRVRLREWESNWWPIGICGQRQLRANTRMADDSNVLI